MSEPKLISPLLDGFVMGDPISEHHGVRCCPAMVKESGSKYIVKIISIPASQVQLEALLLTGAYKSEADALSYFKALSQDVLEEAQTLTKLSKLEGFLPYEDCQVVAKENEVGYDVYLLSPYKRSLESFLRKHTMTHLGAVNLGLDMCASLAVCRQAGYLYVDLKPDNIFISADQEYRIGDLGFMKLDSLKYASLPEKYRSAYTAPEIADAYASINTTVDIYAAGMILYQAYNGGILPQLKENEPLVAPAFADYEMAEIILKACDPDPEARWADPIQMGQALVAYMQRNGANDEPIVPPAVVAPEVEAMPEEDEAEPSAEATGDAGEQICIEEFTEDAPDTQEAAEQEELPEFSAPEQDEDDPANLSFLDEMESDDTAPNEETAQEVSYDELSEDIGNILAQADELIAHETPEGVVAPEPIEVPMPEPVPAEPVQEAEEVASEETAAEDSAPAEEDPEEEDPEEDYEDDYEDDYEPMDKKTGKKLLGILLGLIILAGLVFGGYQYYQHFYLQSVSSMTLQGSEDQLYVYIESDVDDALLTVVCTDTHGTRQEASVADGVAVFNGLNPNTLYNVKLEISGLRKLTGQVSDSYTTPAQTSVLNLTAVTGSEEGTVILSFNIDGMDANNWTVSCSADGEETRNESFTGHMATISGLTLGANYTFTLSTPDAVILSGDTKVDHLVCAPVFAEDVMISGLAEGSITVSWAAPANATKNSWIVRCYSDTGYDKTLTTDETSVVFDGIDPNTAYTVEVTADGMSTGVRTYMTAGAVTVTDAAAQVSGSQSITVTWNTPEAGSSQWLVVFTVDGTGSQEIIRCSKPEATLSPVIPGQAYSISIQLEDGTTVFGGNLNAEVPEASSFNGYKLGFYGKKVSAMVSMCLRPQEEGWTYKDVEDEDYAHKFTAGQEAGFVLYIPSKYSVDDVDMDILFVTRDAEGKLLSYSTVTRSWRDMWHSRYCELDAPALPQAAGSYTMEIFFNGYLYHSQDFSITATE